jgi:tetratricopeptide (TPR) repeat protein
VSHRPDKLGGSRPDRCLIAAVAFVLTLTGVLDARAEHLSGHASPFDGPWSLMLTLDGFCAGRWPPLEIDMTSGEATGRYSDPRFGGWQYKAHVGADASFALALSGVATIDLKGTLAPMKGEGELTVHHPEGRCRGTWIAKRVGAPATDVAAVARSSSRPQMAAAPPAPRRQAKVSPPRPSRPAASLDAGAAVPLPEPDVVALDSLEAPSASNVREPVLPPFTVRTPKAGQRNAFALLTTPALAEAYEAYLAGDGEASLAALDRQGDGGTLLVRWHVLMQRVAAMILLGRSAEAERLIQEAAALERQTFGGTVLARAARGRVRLTLGEYDAAVADFAIVANELRRWSLPTHYGQIPEPSEVSVLVYKTSAQLQAYAGIAEALVELGRAEAALPWAHAAEAGYVDVHAVGFHAEYGQYLPVYTDSFVGRAANLVFLGAAQIVSSNDAATGERSFAAARAFYDAIGYEAGSATAEARQANALLEIGDAAGSALLAGRAADRAARLGLSDLLWRVELVRGRALTESGDMANAEKALRRAQDAVEDVSGSLSGDRAKRRFGAGKDDLTDRLVHIDVANGDFDTLFRDLERGRARAFVDMLADRALARGRSTTLLREIRDLDRTIIEARLRRSIAVRGRPDTGQAQAASIERRVLVDRLRAESPDLADAMSISTAELSDVRRALGPNEMLVYGLPARGDDTLAYLWITRDGARLVATETTSDDMLRGLQAFADGLALEDAEMQRSAGRSFVAALGLANVPRGVLYMVPSGNLHFVPWGALPLETPVVVLPTGGWILRQASPPRQGAVALGDPDLAGTQTPLPGAAEEARAVAQEYGVTALTGLAATFDNTVSSVGDGVHVLHLATHGVFDAVDPLRSVLFFADRSGPRAVTAADLFEQPLVADLVVLSACETGLGATEAGEDYLGLARSFYLGGAKSVVNSLWRVDDAGTAQFMTAFHRELAMDGNLAAAWLKARNAVRDAGLPPSVYGAFVLGGAATLTPD